MYYDIIARAILVEGFARTCRGGQWPSEQKAPANSPKTDVEREHRSAGRAMLAPTPEEQ